MIYVGIGSLQCSGDKREIFPIMLDTAGSVTIANINHKRLTWHMMTRKSGNVYWIGDVSLFSDDSPGIAINKLMDLKKGMMNPPKESEDENP